MPIRPENKDRYPENWHAISREVKDRARWCCEWCGAVHGERHPLTGAKVVLTVAHLDHTPENCSMDNLVALCQKCHNSYDAPVRQRGRRARERRAKEAKGQRRFKL